MSAEAVPGAPADVASTEGAPGLAVAVVGASGGIGAALVEALVARADVAAVHATHHRSPAGATKASVAGFGGPVRIVPATLDATDEAAVEAWLGGIEDLDWLINCVGMLHDGDTGPEKSIRQLDPAHFEASMRINALPTLLLAKHAHRLLKRSERGAFATVSARVGSIADNALGGWYSYRASKAALNMALKCLSIEWGRGSSSLRVAALHPGTTDTALSKPFQQNVPEGKLFPPDKTAGFLLARMDELHDGPTGRFLAWDGEEIPW